MCFLLMQAMLQTDRPLALTVQPLIQMYLPVAQTKLQTGCGLALAVQHLIQIQIHFLSALVELQIGPRLALAGQP
jgi:hypothetical protein